MKRLVAIVLGMLLLSGCASSNKDLVGIKAISAGSTLPKTYVIVPANIEEFNKNSLLYKQVAQSLRQSLVSRGFTEQTNPDKASQIILLGLYRTGAQNSTRNVTVPIFGQTGISSSTTQGTINSYGTVNSYSNGYGTVNSYGTGGGTINSTTTYTPTYGITGSYTKQVTDTFYTIIISLKSYDFVKFKEKITDELWETQIALTSSSPDGLGAFKGIARYVSPYIDTTLDSDVKTYLSPEEYLQPPKQK